VKDANLFLILLCSVLLASCAHAPKDTGLVEHTRGKAPAEAPELYRQAVDELESENFGDAVKDFDRFVLQNPASRFSQAALLNSGRALEGLKNWAGAADRYHQVINSTSRSPRLQAMALYRLSYVDEATGDDVKMVVDLTDLLSRKNALPQEIAEGEMPARLAAAYARVGNFEKAQHFYRQAEIGIARLRQSQKETPEWLPRTLYVMGETSRSKLSWTDFEMYIRPLARSQVYLLQSAELARAPWSEKAAGELLEIYNEMLSVIEVAQPAQDVIAKRALQQRQWARIGLVVECLEDLRARMVPDAARGEPMAKLNKGLKLIDQKITSLLEERPAGEGLTQSAIEKRKERILGTEATTDSLEQAFLKSSREVKPALVPPAPARPSTRVEIAPDTSPIKSESQKEDPNL
jgi:tetratricopeptide (TPR) repeat protein